MKQRLIAFVLVGKEKVLPWCEGNSIAEPISGHRYGQKIFKEVTEPCF